LFSTCYADEIIFKDQKGVQIGTVLEEDEQTVTIRFLRESIQSIVRSQEEVSSAEKTQDLKLSPLTELQLQERLEGLQERIERLEKNLEEDKKTGVLLTPGPSKDVVAIEQLLQEEMGGVKGIILWKKKPLVNGSVKIVLERYTGFSFASLQKMFLGDKEKSSDQIILETKTNTQGRYVFEKVPPGQYRVYWMPDTETGWVHRIREKPDFGVTAGKLTIHNIPEKKK
jgi:predicted RNase H-like nuclease (RuvC/YqgF family)